MNGPTNNQENRLLAGYHNNRPGTRGRHLQEEIIPVQENYVAEYQPNPDRVRFLQREPYANTYIRQSTINEAGDGLFALHRIQPNQYICRIGSGYRVPENVQFELDDHSFILNDIVCLTNIWVEYGSYVNDPLDPQLVNASISWHAPTSSFYLLSHRLIQIREEIFIAYGRRFWVCFGSPDMILAIDRAYPILSNIERTAIQVRHQGLGRVVFTSYGSGLPIAASIIATSPTSPTETIEIPL